MSEQPQSPEEEGVAVDYNVVIQNLSGQISDLSLKVAIQAAYIQQLEKERDEFRVIVDTLGERAMASLSEEAEDQPQKKKGGKA